MPCSRGVSSGGPAAVRVTCDVATGKDGTPRVAVTLDIASWIVLDHAMLDEQHIASMRRRISEPSGAWAPGSALDLPEEVVPVAWPSMPRGVYLAVANQIHRRRMSRDGVQRMMRNHIVRVDSIEFRLVCCILLHAVDIGHLGSGSAAAAATGSAAGSGPTPKFQYEIDKITPPSDGCSPSVGCSVSVGCSLSVGRTDGRTAVATDPKNGNPLCRPLSVESGRYHCI